MMRGTPLAFPPVLGLVDPVDFIMPFLPWIRLSAPLGEELQKQRAVLWVHAGQCNRAEGYAYKHRVIPCRSSTLTLAKAL
jgi:hypothetical protein